MNLLRRTLRLAAIGVALTWLLAPGAAADEWNDRTILTFSAPVMVPGATLAPGEYVFELADTRADRHLVRIYAREDNKLITTTQAVPIKREQVSDDVTLTVKPTEAGAPIAVTAWFYPGSRYGHQFVYPDEQARDIASRTRTLILSSASSGDKTQGQIHLLDAQGRSQAWQQDTTTQREWAAWRDAHPAAASARGTTQAGAADVPVARADRGAMRVKVDDIEDNPAKYIGQRVSVDAEVEDVLGPRVFTIDEPNWGDLEGEIMVVLPSALAALVRENDRVTVEGTVRPFLQTDVEHEWGWLGWSPDVEVKAKAKPVLVADRIVGGNNNVAMVIDLQQEPRATGTSGSTANSVIKNVGELAAGNRSLVGRRVDLMAPSVTSAPGTQGFFIGSGNDRVFVLPASAAPASIASARDVHLSGVIMQMPSHMLERLNAPGAFNHDIYVYATEVTP